MAQEMEGKMVSVQVGGCSKSTQHFIGVNVQYVHDGKTRVRTLAVEELFLSSTSSNLKAIITRILRKYGIPVKAIVSFTSDNGANYALAGKLLDRDAAEEMMSEFEEPLENWAEGVELTQDELRLQSVRCAAHTLQLVVEDACKADRETKPLLDAVKKLSTFLRTETMARQIKQARLPLPCLFVVTRWGSDYDILKSVARLKNFMELTLECTANDRQKYFLTEEQWEKANTLLDDLRPAIRATTKLQAEHLTLGDFRAIWTELTYSLESRTSQFSGHLLEAMTERIKSAAHRRKNRGERLPPLFHYPSFNAAVFLDPRYVSLLSAEQVAEAKSYLIELWQRQQGVRGVAMPEAEQGASDSEDEPAAMDCVADADNSEDEGSSKFRRLLERQNQARRVEEEPSSAASSWRERLRCKLDEYDRQVKPMPTDANVLDYWSSKRLVWPELHDLALIVLAIPATQCSVERLFSSLRYILRPQRYQLSPESIEDIVLLHTNADLVKQSGEELLLSSSLPSGPLDTDTNSEAVAESSCCSATASSSSSFTVISKVVFG